MAVQLHCIIKKTSVIGEKGVFLSSLATQYSFPYLREPRLR